MFPGAAGARTMGRRGGCCTHRRAGARTPRHARPPVRPHPGGERLQQPAARGAPATTKPPRAAGEDGEDAGTVSSILPARRRLPRARGRRRPGLSPAARPRPRAAGGAGGGGSGVAQSRDPARRCARLRATRAASAPRCGPSWPGARLLPRRRPKLRAASVSRSSGPWRPPRANTPRRNLSHPRRSPAPGGKDAPDAANE